VHSGYVLGDLDFFITSEISDKIRALSENVLSLAGHHGHMGFHAMRLYLEMDVAPKLALRFGRIHMPLGSFMQAYHHALLFQLATSRPVIMNFEMEGGLLPAHFVGAQAFGNAHLGSVLFGYTLAVGNGRGQSSGQVLNAGDHDRFKAIVARLTAAPDALDGVEFGISAYLDRIPGGFRDPVTGNLLVPESLDELIVGGHIAAPIYPIQLWAEFYGLVHRGRISKERTQLLGGFLQAGYSFDHWTPYGRIDWVERDQDDAFYNASGLPTEAFNLVGGVRYDAHEHVALKLDYTRQQRSKADIVTLQAAFGL
jgi:hypothetical protein